MVVCLCVALWWTGGLSGVYPAFWPNGSWERFQKSDRMEKSVHREQCWKLLVGRCDLISMAQTIDTVLWWKSLHGFRNTSENGCPCTNTVMQRKNISKQDLMWKSWRDSYIFWAKFKATQVCEPLGTLKLCASDMVWSTLTFLMDISNCSQKYCSS